MKQSELQSMITEIVSQSTTTLTKRFKLIESKLNEKITKMDNKIELLTEQNTILLEQNKKVGGITIKMAKFLKENTIPTTTQNLNRSTSSQKSDLRKKYEIDSFDEFDVQPSTVVEQKPKIRQEPSNKYMDHMNEQMEGLPEVSESNIKALLGDKSAQQVKQVVGK